jgi:SAM-dependent methyltransferase
MTDYTYVGAELDLFAAATNWKSYLRRQLAPYIGRDVLEVGAGFGGTTRMLCGGDHDAWTCLEPDAALAGRLADSLRAGDLPACCRVEVGTLADLPAGAEYDTLLYIDVLEHIEDDGPEMARAAERVKPGGHVVVLSPAHQWLFTPFDKAIGHFRRYTKRSLKAVAPPGLEQIRMGYLDSVGMLASLGNRLFLNRSMPRPGQIAVWDKLMVPVSRVLDPLLAHSTGRSILGVWRRPPGGTAR